MASADFQRARTPDQRQRRQAVILAAGRELLDELPLADVSLRELARRVGLSKSNVVRYFATRETVFLAILLEDWGSWLTELESALPRRDARRRPQTTHRLVATAIAETLTGRPRLCGLLAECQSVLERNVPRDVALEFKTSALANLNRLAELVRTCVPDLDDEHAFRFAGITWALTVGAWPMANPSPVVSEVLARPGLEALRVDFTPAITTALTLVLDGSTRPRNVGANKRTP